MEIREKSRKNTSKASEIATFVKVEEERFQEVVRDQDSVFRHIFLFSGNIQSSQKSGKSVHANFLQTFANF